MHLDVNIPNYIYTKKTLKCFNCDEKLLRFNHSNKSPLLLKDPVNMYVAYVEIYYSEDYDLLGYDVVYYGK
jgi:hypothetical protein